MCGCRYGLLKRDAYKEGTVSGTSSYFTPATTTNSYDANNNLYAVSDSGNAANNRSFVTDDAGRVLYKAQNGAVERQLIANGEVLGRFGGALADFNFGYTPISASFPKANPGTFAVGASDSLRSIAKAVYGDSSLWYLIAEANGLQSDKELRVGQTLNVPNRVTSAANNAGTFKPYDPSVVGDTAPTLPNPPPPPGKKGCGGLGKLIMVVVAVVATIATAGALAGASGSAVFSTGASVLGGTAAAGTTVAGSLGVIGTGMVAGAVGSIASQVAGNMLGVQDGFSWKSVALGAISAGATAGVGQALGAAGQAAGQTTLSWQQVAARAAVGNAITQGVGVITGLQAKFDWKGVAASAVGAGVGQAVGGTMGDVFGKGTFGARLATGLVAGTAAAVMRGGKVAIQQVAVDAFGNALGYSLAEASSGSNPASAYDHRNGSDVQSDQAYGDRAIREYMARTPGAGMSEADYWNRPALTQADRYAQVYGGEASQTGDRLTLSRGSPLDDLDREIAEAKAVLNAMDRDAANARSIRAGNAITSRLNRESVIRETVYGQAAAEASAGGVGAVGGAEMPNLGMPFDNPAAQTFTIGDQPGAGSAPVAGASSGELFAPGGSDWNLRGTAGFSAVTAYDSWRRDLYKAEALRIRETHTAQFRAATTLPQKEAIARAAFDARQNLRTSTQNLLSPSGRYVSMAIEPPRTFDSQVKHSLNKLGAGASTEDAYKRITYTAGSSNPLVSTINNSRTGADWLWCCGLQRCHGCTWSTRLHSGRGDRLAGGRRCRRHGCQRDDRSDRHGHWKGRRTRGYYCGCTRVDRRLPCLDGSGRGRRLRWRKLWP